MPGPPFGSPGRAGVRIYLFHRHNQNHQEGGTNEITRSAKTKKKTAARATDCRNDFIMLDFAAKSRLPKVDRLA